MLEDIFSLKGKVAVVVGASRGIGKAMSIALAGAGADLVVASRTVDALEQVRDEIIALGRKSIYVETDVSKEDNILRMVDTVIEEFGKIDILINCAGVYYPSMAFDVKFDEWKDTFDVNLKGLFIASREVGKHMAEQKSGKIINIASIGGMRALPSNSPYACTKAAVIQLTRSLALEFGRYNIQVNAVAPGWFDTAIAADVLADPRNSKYFLFRSIVKRFGVPEELGGIAIFLSSKASDFMTGQTVVIDGGISVGL